jgi:hypothetical protein
VDDVLGRQPARAGRNRVADLDRPERDRFALDAGTACPFDGARDAGSHSQVVVRGVCEHVDVERGDVALDDRQLHGVES